MNKTKEEENEERENSDWVSRNNSTRSRVVKGERVLSVRERTRTLGTIIDLGKGQGEVKVKWRLDENACR